MSFILYLCIIVSIFTVVLGFIGHDIKILLPMALGITILVAIIRAIIIKWKNSY
jgi:5-bromo-4-chloroindolyl phosphate hydrolysis protein